MAKKAHNTKRSDKVVSPSEISKAYHTAQQRLKDFSDGYIEYDKIFTSPDQVKSALPSITSGMILNFRGLQFFWKRSVGEPLIFYGRDGGLGTVANGEVIELCRMRVPDEWVGVGRFTLDWPESAKDKDEDLLLLHLYLYSPRIKDFDYLVSDDNTTAASMAFLFLGDENAKLFYKFSEKNFTSLQ